MTAYTGVLKTLEWIERELFEPIGVGEMAAVSGYSPFYFSRQFNRFTGHSPYDYLMRRRLTVVLKRIRSGNERLMDLAFDCGFDSYEGFSRAFKKMFDVSPSGVNADDDRMYLHWREAMTEEDIQGLMEGGYRVPKRLEREGCRFAGRVDRLAYQDRDHMSSDHCLHGMIADSVKDSWTMDLHCTIPQAGKLLYEVEAGTWAVFKCVDYEIYREAMMRYVFQTWLPHVGCSREIVLLEEVVGDNQTGLLWVLL